jgi:hypothetical protein
MIDAVRNQTIHKLPLLEIALELVWTTAHHVDSVVNRHREITLSSQQLSGGILLAQLLNGIFEIALVDLQLRDACLALQTTKWNGHRN